MLKMPQMEVQMFGMNLSRPPFEFTSVSYLLNSGSDAKCSVKFSTTCQDGRFQNTGEVLNSIVSHFLKLHGVMWHAHEHVTKQFPP